MCVCVSVCTYFCVYSGGRGSITWTQLLHLTMAIHHPCPPLLPRQPSHPCVGVRLSHRIGETLRHPAEVPPLHNWKPEQHYQATLAPSLSLSLLSLSLSLSLLFQTLSRLATSTNWGGKVDFGHRPGPSGGEVWITAKENSWAQAMRNLNHIKDGAEPNGMPMRWFVHGQNMKDVKIG